MNETIIEFEKFSQSKGERKLTNVQNIVNFYFWFRKLSAKYEPYTRHLSAAKKIDVWTGGNLNKAYELIIFIGEYFNEKNLEYSLDTIYRKIPLYEESEASEDEYRKFDEEERRRSQEIINEGRQARHELQSKNSERQDDDFDF